MTLEQRASTESTSPSLSGSAASGSVARRTLLRVGGGGLLAAALTGVRGAGVPYLSDKGWLSADGAFAAVSTALGDKLYTEVFPTSPLILDPFHDELNVPSALRPVPPKQVTSWPDPPGPGIGQQNSLRNEQHQIWPSTLGLPDPIVYEIDLLVRPHSFTTSKVLPIDDHGRPTVSFDASGNRYAAGEVRTLPPSTIYGFNGTFPGPMINAEYGRPALVRFRNRLDENPLGLDRQDFGSPVWQFLTHLHNAHTAPESDGNPHYSIIAGPREHGYLPQMWVDNLYLNHPAGGDDREKQSFFWFHDHTMDFTGADVYKGMVGLYPIYDPKNGTDMGDERQGLRLPGVREDHPDGSFDVKYDIPLALYDCSLDDGVTMHHDMHDSQFPDAGNPRTHPEWWGMTFHKHFPNHGFVGDIFTVNGTAYPVLQVDRRKYRFRFLDCSVSRIYELKLMSSTNGPKSAVSLGYDGDELQGQYRIPDGQQCMQFTQIASDGGLLPFPLKRDSFELWPAKRREFIVDFTKYLDGSPTTKGDVIYLTNIMKMTTGRMWDSSSRFSPDPEYQVPLLKFVIGDDVPDDSEIPVTMRPVPPIPSDWRSLAEDRKIFEVERGSAGGEIEWLINGVQFDPEHVGRSLRNPNGNTPLAEQKRGSFAVWEIRNGGGGWVHPFHLHMEEHRVLSRNGKDVTQHALPSHPEDRSREDLVALDPGESVLVYRGFRTFVGPYVAHCHNLLHEDHAMMFGWSIIP
ncbi:MAG: multicopper oxidase domain-containing protein [Nocardioidaceae bacterium]|nr:multicopper oxidase domain-containing protein [Nocardioidaceae bacterium]NUS49709.1 multicopper oxidase domain-containing protein [Nocardioidaceae bacterium]